MTNEEYKAMYLGPIKKIRNDTIKLVLITITIGILVFVCLFYGGKKLYEAHKNYNIAQTQIAMQENAQEGNDSSEENGNAQETKEVTKMSNGTRPFPLGPYIIICFICAIFWVSMFLVEIASGELAEDELKLLWIINPAIYEQ